MRKTTPHFSSLSLSWKPLTLDINNLSLSSVIKNLVRAQVPLRFFLYCCLYFPLCGNPLCIRKPITFFRFYLVNRIWLYKNRINVLGYGSMGIRDGSTTLFVSLTFVFTCSNGCTGDSCLWVYFHFLIIKYVYILCMLVHVCPS